MIGLADERGFLFTTDSILALIPLMIVVVTVAQVSVPPKSEPMELEANDIAENILSKLEQDGTLKVIALEPRKSATREYIEEYLDRNVPIEFGYAMVIEIDGEKELVASDTVSSMSELESLLSGIPNYASAVRHVTTAEKGTGWVGRAWFKVEEAAFMEQERTVTTTAVNFHNWLSNFYNGPTEWGPGEVIGFYIPSDEILSSKMILGCGEFRYNLGSPYEVDVQINGQYWGRVNRGDWTYLYTIGGGYYGRMMWIDFEDVPENLLRSGRNELFLDFRNPGDYDYMYYNNMPWFSLIVTYNHTMLVPVGLVHRIIRLPDAEGFAVAGSSCKYKDTMDRDGDGNTDEILDCSAADSVRWNRWIGDLASTHRETEYPSDPNSRSGIPFGISQNSGLPDGDGGSAITVVKEFELPDNVKIFDAVIVLNILGATDNARVEVYDYSRDKWVTVFNSFNLEGVSYSARGDGYGNLPTVVSIRVDPKNINPNDPDHMPTELIRPGKNKVRVTIWDFVPSTDWDWVGIVDSYISVSYSSLPIDWQTFEFQNYQSGGNSVVKKRKFKIGRDAELVYFFFGVGSDTRKAKVWVRRISSACDSSSSSWKLFYDERVSPGQFINLKNVDTESSPHIMTEYDPQSGEWVLCPGTYEAKIAVYGPNEEWESGDWNRNAEVYSGSRVVVLYPEFIRNVWAMAYSDSPTKAKAMAVVFLLNRMISEGVVDPSDLDGEPPKPEDYDDQDSFAQACIDYLDERENNSIIMRVMEQASYTSSEPKTGFVYLYLWRRM